MKPIEKPFCVIGGGIIGDKKPNKSFELNSIFDECGYYYLIFQILKINRNRLGVFRTSEMHIHLLVRKCKFPQDLVIPT